jgi:hypothetical protein
VLALKEIKNKKAAGIDGIPAEIMKANLSVTADAAALFQRHPGI